MKKICIFFCGLLLVSAVKDDTHKDFNLKIFEKSLACVPKGTFMFYDSCSELDEGIRLVHQVKSRRVSVDSFYMFNHEVTNEDYRCFLADIKNKAPHVYMQMLPDTLVWRDKLAYNEPYVKYYFRHPAYQDYPVVGLTHEQAEYYCKWLTEKYMSDSRRKYKKVKFELPTLYQWEYAAIGGAKDYTDFPWKGNYMRAPSGRPFADFLYISESSIKKTTVYVKDTAGKYKEQNAFVATDGADYFGGPAGDLNDAADITCPPHAYPPNGYGLYNMAGNVKEYVKEEGITKGGSWRETGYYLMNRVEQPYDSAKKATDDRGFRFIMEVLK